MSKFQKTLPTLGGYVTDPQSFTRNQKENPYGLYSQCIFGPKQYNCCACGKLQGFVNHGKICDKCNVLCGDNELRSTQFGKIQTIFPFVKPNKKLQLNRKLGSGPDVDILLNPNRAEVNAHSKRYLRIKEGGQRVSIVTELKCEDGYVTIPFRITGIYSLYLVLKFVHKYMTGIAPVEDIFNEEYLTHELKVLPPNLRILTYDQNNNRIMTPPVSKYYQSILSRNKGNIPLVNNLSVDENDWLNKIYFNLKNGLYEEEIVDHTVIEYDSLSASYQYFVNQIYDTVYDELSGKTGLIRGSILGKNIEFSARTVVRTDPGLQAYEVKVSKQILKKLWMPYFIHYLTSQKNYDFDYCYDKFIQDQDSQEHNELFDEFLDWFVNLESERDQYKRLIFVNRQPTLWRHGISAFKAVPSEDFGDDTIGMSPLALEAFNMDLK